MCWIIPGSQANPYTLHNVQRKLNLKSLQTGRAVPCVKMWSGQQHAGPTWGSESPCSNPARLFPVFLLSQLIPHLLQSFMTFRGYRPPQDISTQKELRRVPSVFLMTPWFLVSVGVSSLCSYSWSPERCTTSDPTSCSKTKTTFTVGSGTSDAMSVILLLELGSYSFLWEAPFHLIYKCFLKKYTEKHCNS